MKCLLCAKYSLNVICKECLNWLEITPQKREIEGFSVYSFYDFDEVRECLHSKYFVIGSKIIHFLSRKMAQFLRDERIFARELGIMGIALDDEPRGGYSHTAIIAKELKCAGIVPLFGALRSQNRVSYAGKDLEFRRKNPRAFRLFRNLQKGAQVVLIDDLITTGITMLEAKRVLENSGANVLFGICLSDARGIIKE